jgi:Uma2 family endonuclease
MGALKLDNYSVEEYFEIDETSELRCEYINGEIIAMAGSTVRHNEIAMNIAFSLRSGLNRNGKHCKTMMSDVRLHIGSLNRYYYPDVMVVCGAENLESNKGMENPILIVEVLSDSTETTDLTTKLSAYQQIDSLVYYLIVSQTSPFVLCYEKRENGWLLTIFNEISQTIELPLLELSISLSDAYATI